MTASSENAGVVFTGDMASYTVGNGNVIQYKKVGGIFYHADTPESVINALEHARSARRRVRIHYGDSVTGRDWLEEHDVEGYLSNSTGPLKVPILVHNRRSFGGGALLDHCIVKITSTTGGVLYQHAHYHAGMFTIREIGADEAFHGETLRSMGYTHAVDVDGQAHANFKSMAAAQRYVRKMIG